MKDYQKAFIELAIECEALKFGEFELKSGRVSPYFFNAGAFQTGASLAKLGRFYAQALVDADEPFDMLLGPAYKGIPLVSATACAFYDQHDKDYPYAFNRKEAKSHGEGGTMVGAPLKGSVAIIDDVITAGTAIRDVLKLFEGSEAKPSVIVVGLDRNEVGKEGTLSAVQELERLTFVPVKSIVQLSNIITYLEGFEGSGIGRYSSSDLASMKERIKAYRDRYGAKSE